MGWLLMVVGLNFVAASFPVDGLPGILLALSGIGLLWAGYFRVRRDVRQGGDR